MKPENFTRLLLKGFRKLDSFEEPNSGISFPRARILLTMLHKVYLSKKYRRLPGCQDPPTCGIDTSTHQVSHLHNWRMEIPKSRHPQCLKWQPHTRLLVHLIGMRDWPTVPPGLRLNESLHKSNAWQATLARQRRIQLVSC